MPETVAKFLDENTSLLREAFSTSNKGNVGSRKTDSMLKIKERISELINDESKEHKEYEIIDVESIVAFGPKNRGPNLLIDATGKKLLPSVWEDKTCRSSPGDPTSLYQNSVINGFQLAAASGPLCEEPLMGVAFLLLEWEFLSYEDKLSDPYGPISGQVMSTVREACRKSLNLHPRRLKAAMYSCNIQVPQDILGKCHTLIFNLLLSTM
jgi:ribosome assembly protein 1